jgi:DNA repair exonuclease SbcCD ATPase subunit
MKKILAAGIVCAVMFLVSPVFLSGEDSAQSGNTNDTEGIVVNQDGSDAQGDAAEEAPPKTDLEIAQEKVEELDAQIQELQELLAAAEEEKRGLQDSLVETEELTVQIQELEELLASAEEEREGLEQSLDGAELEVKTAGWRTESFLKELEIFKDNNALRMREFPKYAEAQEKRRKGDEAGNQQDFAGALAYYQDAVRLLEETIEEVHWNVAEEQRIAAEAEAARLAEEQRIAEEKRRKAEDAAREYAKAQEIMDRTKYKYAASRQ